MLFAVSISSRFFSEEQTIEQLVTTVTTVTGPRLANAIGRIASQLNTPDGNNVLFTTIWFLVTLFASSNVFRQLVVALDTIWEIPYQPVRRTNGVIEWGLTRARKYIVGLLMTLLAIFSLPVLLVTGVLMNSFLLYFESWLPGIARIVPLFTFVLVPSVLVVFCLLVFRYVPSKRMAWSEIWVGATVTGLVLAIAEILIGRYASLSSIPAFYGVAGSIVALLLWAYFSSYILLVGAEFTYVWGHWDELR